MKINWSSILFQNLKKMIQSDKQSVGFAISISRLFEDAGVNMRDLIILHKYKILNASTIVSLRPKGRALNISATGILVVKKEIGEELTESNKVYAIICLKSYNIMSLSKPRRSFSGVYNQRFCKHKWLIQKTQHVHFPSNNLDYHSILLILCSHHNQTASTSC